MCGPMGLAAKATGREGAHANVRVGSGFVLKVNRSFLFTTVAPSVLHTRTHLEICQDQDAPAFEVGGVGVVDPQAGTNRARPGRLPEVDLLTPSM